VPNNSGAVDLGSLTPEEQAQVDALAERSDTEPEKPTVITAFAIVVSEDGNPSIVSYEHDDFVVLNPATPDLVYGAISTVLKDLAAQETAQAAAQMTAQLMAAQARAMMEQQQAAALRQGLGKDLGRV
jgi:type III secretory pathway lipoprotein EscJ